MMLLEGKKVLITGANRGIGLAIAKKFAEHGAALWLNGLDDGKLKVTCSEISEKYGVECNALCFDVSDPDAVKKGFQQLLTQTKSLDVLVNNAGTMDDAMLGMVNRTLIDRNFSINTYSVLYCSQYAARIMQRNNSGSIINMASIVGRVGSSGQSVYAASKAAVIAITQSLSKELANKQIRVNAIAPGFIDTDLTDSLSVESKNRTISNISLARIGEPSEVADVALFLASSMSSYVTGQVVNVDGGMLL